MPIWFVNPAKRRAKRTGRPGRRAKRNGPGREAKLRALLSSSNVHEAASARARLGELSAKPRKKARTAAQKAATKKLIAANRRARKSSKTKRRAAAPRKVTMAKRKRRRARAAHKNPSRKRRVVRRRRARKNPGHAMVRYAGPTVKRRRKRRTAKVAAPKRRRRHAKAVTVRKRRRARRPYQARGLRSMVRARRAIKRTKRRGSGLARIYMKRHKMRSNPGGGGLRGVLGTVIPAVLAIGLGRLLSSKIAPKLPFLASLGANADIAMSAGMFAAAYVVTGKVKALAKYRNAILIGLGINAAMSAVKTFAPTIAAQIGLGDSGVYDGAMAGYQYDVGEYVQVGEFGEYIQVGSDGMGDTSGAIEQLAGSGSPRMLAPVGIQHAQANVPDWTPEFSQNDLYTGVFANV